MPLTIAVATVPTMLNMQLTRSDSFRAAWIFFVCPINRMRMVRASKDVLMTFFLAPYLAFVLAVAAYFSGHLLPAVVHVTLLGLLGQSWRAAHQREAELAQLRELVRAGRARPTQTPPRSRSRFSRSAGTDVASCACIRISTCSSSFREPACWP